MTEPASTASAFLILLKSIVEAIKDLDLKTVIVMTVAFAMVAGGYLTADHKLLSSSHWTNLGGVDLGEYCASYGYEHNSEDACYSPINMDAACAWSWGMPMRAQMSGLYSTKCFTLTNPPVYKGGVSKISQYCKHLLPHSADVVGAVSGKSWICREDINKGAACAWQFQKQGLEARKDHDTWLCYGRADS